MRRWILALAAIAFLAAGTAMADSCQTPCAKAQAPGCGTKAACGTAASCGAKMGCGQKMDCGPAGACNLRMKMDCCDRGGLHASHDPNNIWYRGPAPKCGLFDCLGGGCGPRRGMDCKVVVMKRMGMPGCGPMGACGDMGACGGKAACAHGPACGGACMEEPGCASMGAGGGMGACGGKAACAHGPACGGACMEKPGCASMGAGGGMGACGGTSPPS